MTKSFLDDALASNWGRRHYTWIQRNVYWVLDLGYWKTVG